MPQLLRYGLFQRWLLSAACSGLFLTMSTEVSASDPGRKNQSEFGVNKRHLQTLGNLLKNIEKQHGVSFVCKSDLLDLKIDVGTETFVGSGFAEKLQRVFKPYNLTLRQITSQQFTVTGKNNEKNKSFPAISERTEAIAPGSNLALSATSFTFTRNDRGDQAPIPVTGTVTARNGNTPLRGVSVSVKGTLNVVVTDEGGRFSIEVPSEQSILVFSSVGYVTVERAVSGGRVDVVMEEDTKGMDEVVVVGYGTQKKVNLTGAVSAITADDLAGRPLTAVSTGMQGLIPGVTIRSFSAMPGQTGSAIRIRGIGTLGDANPLVVIDGIQAGSMDILNPDDIESISVLKDAASSSIYGVRGANGVILITTKKGKTDSKPAITYSNYIGFQTPTALPQFLGSPEYMKLLNESLQNVGRPTVYTDSMINIAVTGSDLNYYANTNWMEEIYKKRAGQQNHNLSINGGGNNVNYYLSYGYLKQDGLVTGDNFGAKRNNVRLRLNTKLLDRLDLDANLGYIDRRYSESSENVDEASGPIYASHQISPLVPVRFTTGGWGYLGGSRNPVAVATNGGYNNFASQEFTGNLSATLNLFQGFRLRGQYGLVKSNSQRDIYHQTIDYYSPITGDRIYQTNAPSRIDNRDYVSTYQTWIGIAEYERTFGKHEIKAMIGVSQDETISKSFTANRTNVVSPAVPNLNVATGNQVISASADPSALRSLFGRVNYVLNRKYLAELNFRYDGTTVFAKDVRWNFFPSASVGWRISEENFFNGLKSIFNDVKLRASYGELGNDRVGSLFPFLATIGPVGGVPPIGNVLTPGYAQTALPNPILTWENAIKQNIGLDISMLRNRLGITADYFIHNTEGILLRVTLPDVLGATEPSQNAGKVQNKGWELNLTWRDRIGSAFRYGASFNISDVKNRVTSLGGVPPGINDQVRFLDHPIDAFYGLVAERISQVSDYDYNAATNTYTPKFPVIVGDRMGPGDIMYRDLNKDGVITLAEDRQVIGDPYPRYTYGFRGDMDWKGLDFSFFLQGVGKANGYIKGAGRHAYINESANPQKVHLDRWTPENPNATYPRFTYQLAHNQRFSTFWLEDASYLRLKNIQLGYTLPKRLTERYRIGQLRLYVSADNLFTKTDFFYAYDPETPVSTGGYYPQVKTFVIGLNLNMK
jgi:TonB-linked SusC/RagA family outer membrane protein